MYEEGEGGGGLLWKYLWTHVGHHSAHPQEQYTKHSKINLSQKSLLQSGNKWGQQDTKIICKAFSTLFRVVAGKEYRMERLL